MDKVVASLWPGGDCAYPYSLSGAQSPSGDCFTWANACLYNTDRDAVAWLRTLPVTEHDFDAVLLAFTLAITRSKADAQQLRDRTTWGRSPRQSCVRPTLTNVGVSLGEGFIVVRCDWLLAHPNAFKEAPSPTKALQSLLGVDGRATVVDIDLAARTVAVDLTCVEPDSRNKPPLGRYTINADEVDFVEFSNHARPEAGHVVDVTFEVWAEFAKTETSWRLFGSARVTLFSIYVPTGDSKCWS